MTNPKKCIAKISFAVAAMFLAAACAPKEIVPTLDNLAGKADQVYIESFTVNYLEGAKGEKLRPFIMAALQKLGTITVPAGKSATVEILVKKYNFVSGAQSLFIGGSTTVDYAIQMKDATSGNLLYQIDFNDRPGYAPGGIIGLLAKQDEETEIGKTIANRVKERILDPYKVPVLRTAPAAPTS